VGREQAGQGQHVLPDAAAGGAGGETASDFVTKSPLQAEAWCVPLRCAAGIMVRVPLGGFVECEVFDFARRSFTGPE
jgi:hypothetical protein